jgi:hypothetical protein
MENGCVIIVLDFDHCFFPPLKKVRNSLFELGGGGVEEEKNV